MYNINSPTVQALLNNIPNGVGNMPVYSGNTPTISSYTAPMPTNMGNQTGLPYPSPKQMLENIGTSQFANTMPVYGQVGFGYPQTIVGGYTPNYNPTGYGMNPMYPPMTPQTMLNGYYNPFMGYGQNMGYNQDPYIPEPSGFVDDDDYTYELLERFPPQMLGLVYDQNVADAAYNNGLTYGEQLMETCNLQAALSRAVSKTLGRSKEETERLAESHKLKFNCSSNNDNNNNPTSGFYTGYYNPGSRYNFHIQVVDGEDVVFDSKNTRNLSRRYWNENEYESSYVFSRYNSEMNKIRDINIRNNLYDASPERELDNMDLLDFFNTGSGILFGRMQAYQTQLGISSLYSKLLYDSDSFYQTLMKNNNLNGRVRKRRSRRIYGQYGIMPDGRPVSPGRDPNVAKSFAYNPDTNTLEITAPRFTSRKLEESRSRFMESLGANK